MYKNYHYLRSHYKFEISLSLKFEPKLKTTLLNLRLRNFRAKTLKLTKRKVHPKIQFKIIIMK